MMKHNTHQKWVHLPQSFEVNINKHYNHVVKSCKVLISTKFGNHINPKRFRNACEKSHFGFPQKNALKSATIEPSNLP